MADRNFSDVSVAESSPSSIAKHQSPWQDILWPGLDVVFVGYNPSLPAWRTGHFYANPGNRFYPLLYQSWLTPRLLMPAEDRTLPSYAIGLTDLVPLATGQANQVPKA